MQNREKSSDSNRMKVCQHECVDRRITLNACVVVVVVAVVVVVVRAWAVLGLVRINIHSVQVLMLLCVCVFVMRGGGCWVR